MSNRYLWICPHPSWYGMLERLTLMTLKSPQQQIGCNETEKLVGVLERLTIALKAPAQQTDGYEA